MQTPVAIILFLFAAYASGSETGWGITVDAAGNVYVAGGFEGAQPAGIYFIEVCNGGAAVQQLRPVKQ